MSFLRPVLTVIGLGVLSVMQAAATPVYFIATDQTGGQTQIDVDHSSNWVFAPLLTFDFGGGLFVMKEGQNTTADVTLSFYLGNSSAGTLLAQVVLSNSTFCSQVAGCGQFDPHQFFFTTPIPLTVGNVYFAQLTSSAPDVQSLAYFIKSDSHFISDQNGVTIVPSPVLFDVPEPSTAWLLLTGGVMAAVLRSRVRKA